MTSSNLKYKHYCREDYSLIENYDKAVSDQTQIWVIHHRLETNFSDGTPRPLNARLSAAELKALDMYYARPASELVFLTRAEHISLHNEGNKYSAGHKHLDEIKRRMSEKLKGRECSAETRKKMSAIHKGQTPWNKGRTGVYSEESRKKMSEAGKRKIFSEEHRRRISEGQRGTRRGHWYNNGFKQVQAFKCPEGFVPGMLKKS